MSLSFPVSPSTGQVYQQWQWNGTAWVPATAAGVTSGNKVLLGSTVISAPVAAVNFFSPGFDGTYDQWELNIANAQGSAGGNLMLGFSSDGSTIDATAGNYVPQYAWASTPNSAVNCATTGSATGLNLGMGLDTVASSGMLVIARILQSAAGVQNITMWNGQQWSGGYGWSSFGGGLWGVSAGATIKGLRVYSASGNLVRGTIKLFGIVK